MTTLRETFEDMLFDAMSVAKGNGDFEAVKYLDELLYGLDTLRADSDNLNETLFNLQKRLPVGRSFLVKRYGQSKFGLAILDSEGKVIETVEGSSIERAILKYLLNEDYRDAEIIDF